MCSIASKIIIILAHLETLCLKVKQYFSWVNFIKHVWYCTKDHDDHYPE